MRVVLAELERLYNHLHYLGHLSHTTTLKVGEAEGKLLEERVKQLNARLTGSRLLRSVLIPGGLRRDLAPQGWLGGELQKLRTEIEAYTKRLDATDSHLDRLMTTGPLPRQVALDQGATGPVERASDLDYDLRRDHPYAAYDALEIKVPVQAGGDAYARFLIRVAEIDASLALLREACANCRMAPFGANARRRPDRKGSVGASRRAAHCSTPSISAATAGSRGSRSNRRPFPIGARSPSPCTART